MTKIILKICRQILSAISILTIFFETKLPEYTKIITVAVSKFTLEDDPVIKKSNLEKTLLAIGYKCSDAKKKIYTQNFSASKCSINVDCKNGIIGYPEADKAKGMKGITINERTTCNFSQPENFVVLECITRLLKKGYKPEDLELEKRWNLGHNPKGGRADIVVYDALVAKSENQNKNDKVLSIIECKTFGKEYDKAKKDTLTDGGQLFSYWQQDKSAKWLILYSSELTENGTVEYITESINGTDDKNMLEAAKKDDSILLYTNAQKCEELFKVWDETYDKRLCGDVLFREDTVAYRIGLKPLRKKDLKDFGANDKIVNQFEEILRHNNVSDKENAFNRLVALFICKLVDEMQKKDDDEVEFQYKVGIDTYETLQDRLQRLHRDGMKNFMKEDIFYVSDDYAEKVVYQYTGQKRAKLVEDLRKTLRILKFFTNNDFAFKDVHNEELFYQNGKVLVEVVQLFQNFRIIGSKDIQMIGDMFEQLLNKGFKQNEGQFFTPTPITRFMWESLPLEKIMQSNHGVKYPKVIDYACGAGHFLTEGIEVINARTNSTENAWARDNIYGIEKDYRLARVSKIALFMHGAGQGNIIFGDGLENYREKGIVPENFDILIANPPYAVKAFKPHLKLKENRLATLDKISNEGSEIETLFVERIAQLLKPQGIAAVILPSSILNKEQESFIAAREAILKNFRIHAIAQMGSKTFGATGTNTVILFLEKYNEPPKRIDMVEDSVNSILEGQKLKDWEDENIFARYLEKIDVEEKAYKDFILREKDYGEWAGNEYFNRYVTAFLDSSEYKTQLKKKTFKQSSDEEKTKWCNDHFYNFALKIESEKLTYFALSYSQTVLIVSTPTDNAEQEKFLGYNWSNRKGQEGIQLLSQGGMLNAVAKIISGSFTDKAVIPTEFEKYCRLAKLDAMLDFESIDFENTISVASASYMSSEYTGRYPVKKLKDCVEYATEAVAISEINTKDYVTTDNLLKAKAGVVAYDGIPQLNTAIKYQPNDILLSNIRPYLKKIWRADKYGACSNDVLVLRSIDTAQLLPEYLYTVLSQDMFFDYVMSTAKGVKMPRGDKNKILSYEFPVPPLEIQQEIVVQFNKITKEIDSENTAISELDKSIKNKFVEMFGNLAEKTTISQCCDVEKGTTLTRKEASAGDVPVIAGGMLPNCYHNQSNRPANTITISASGANAGYVNFWNIPIFATDCNTVKVKADSNYLIEYVYYALLTKQEELYSLQKGAGQPHVYGSDIEKVEIYAADIRTQQRFVDFVAKANTRKESLAQKIDKLQSEKQKLIDKYFK